MGCSDNLSPLSPTSPPGQVECRTDLCSSGKDHLACYADLSLPFTVWIKGAETRLQSEAKLPTNKDHLLREKEELDVIKI